MKIGIFEKSCVKKRYYTGAAGGNVKCFARTDIQMEKPSNMPDISLLVDITLSR